MAKYIGVVTGRRILLSNADNVPVELVQNDKDTTIIDFELSKIDYVSDLSQLNVAINYVNIDKDTGESVTDIYTVDKTTVEGDTLKFSWTVGSNASVYAGKCVFQLVLTLTDTNDVITQQWDSTKQSIEVHASLENVNITQPKSFVDLVTQVKKSVSDALAGVITDDKIKQTVEQYLEENPVQVTTDNTLSVAGTPADALATGTAIDSLKEDLNENLHSDECIFGNQISGNNSHRVNYTDYELLANHKPQASNGVTFVSQVGYDSTSLINLEDLPDEVIVPYQPNSNIPSLSALLLNGNGQIWGEYPTSFCTINGNEVFVNLKYIKNQNRWASVSFTSESNKMYIKYNKSIDKKRLSWAFGSNTITVSQSGDGDFTTIQDAINASKDGDIIFIFPGEYEEHLDMYHKNITLKGQSALNTIVFDTSLIYENSPIICGTGSIEDITFHNRKLENKDYSSITRYSYAMHLDQRWRNGNKKISIKNCVFINDFGSASIGCGVVDGCEIEIVNCRIYSNARNGSGLQVHGDSTGNGNADIRISNSLLWGHGNGSGLLLSNGSPEYNTGTTITVHAHNNILYGFYNGIGDLFIKSETNYGNVAKKNTEMIDLNN